MKYVADFYNGLDILNLIIFWGIIVVIVLLIIFVTILINRTKKIKREITSKNNEQRDELPLYNEADEIKTQLEDVKLEEENEPILEKKEPPAPIKIEKNFVAEEHIIEYNNDLFSLDNIKKANEIADEQQDTIEPSKQDEQPLPTGPYQRNVLREMSLGQTSPIGIVKNTSDKTYNDAKELYESLAIENDINEDVFSKKEITDSYEESNNNDTLETSKTVEEQEESQEDEIFKNIIFEEPAKPIDIESKNAEEQLIIEKNVEQNDILENTYEEKRIIEPTKESNSDNYIQEVSKKLASAEEPEEIDRTEYELKQEEEAIISYEELMKRKDELKMIDEEEAVISIEELMEKQQKKEEKIYNITENEGNDDFLKELKSFRQDL